MTWPSSIPDFTSLPDNLVAQEHLQALADALDELGDSWDAYTPTLSSWTVGNGTLSGAYLAAGKLIHFRAKLVLGSTTTVSGNPGFSLPVNAVGARLFGFSAGCYDTSGPSAYALSAFNSSVSIATVKDGTTSLSSTVPFTWATGDEIYVSGTYEAA